MKKRLLGLLVIVAMFLSAPVSAAAFRTIDVIPDITFNGTEATCVVRITADKATDEISATMELWQGRTLVDRWDGEGVWSLKLDKTADVEKGKTYELVINYLVNGVAKPTVRISRTNE